jgi:hypothetical protein
LVAFVSLILLTSAPASIQSSLVILVVSIRPFQASLSTLLLISLSSSVKAQATLFEFILVPV